MPQCVTFQPKRLSEICVEYGSVHIDEILSYEEELELSSVVSDRMTFQRLPNSLHQLLSDKIVDIGSLHENNYRKILNENTTNLLLEGNTDYKCFHISSIAEFFRFLQKQCKNIVRIQLHRSFAEYPHYNFDPNTWMMDTLASVFHLGNLEWINLRDCGINGETLRLIGSECKELKVLNVEDNPNITDSGIRELGNCPELTHLYLKSSFGADEESDQQFDPAVISTVLLRCHNLEILDHEINGLALRSAFEALSMRNSCTFLMSAENNDNCQDCHSSTTDSEHCLMTRTFKIKAFHIECGQIDIDVFFRAVGQYCPFLENITLKNPGFLLPLSLSGIHSLPLRSVTIDEHFLDRQMNFEVKLLLLAVGGSLTSLKLESQHFFDLRVIRRECPHLSSLHLFMCDTISTAPTIWQDPTVELPIAQFESLTHLTLRHCHNIANEIYYDLLASPKLEIMELTGQQWNIFLSAEVLPCFPKALSNLKSLELSYVPLNRTQLMTILDTAVVLKKLQLSRCNLSNKDVEFFKQLIRNNNWALEYSIV